MRTRLHSLTAVLLIALYGLVGLTGESLHYLAGDLGMVAQSSESSSAAGGYYHVHGPDHHGHFHHHDVVEDATPVSTSEEEQGGNAQVGKEFHGEHACPLLTVTSKLKLGAGGGTLTTVDVTAPVNRLHESANCFVFEAVSSSQARGPPRRV